MDLQGEAMSKYSSTLAASEIPFWRLALMESLLVHLQIPFARKSLPTQVAHMRLLLGLGIGRIVVKLFDGSACGGGGGEGPPCCLLLLLGQLAFSLTCGTLAPLVLEPDADRFARNLGRHRIQSRMLKYKCYYCISRCFITTLYCTHLQTSESILWRKSKRSSSQTTFHRFTYHQYLAELLSFCPFWVRISVEPILKNKNLTIKLRFRGS